MKWVGNVTDLRILAQPLMRFQSSDCYCLVSRIESFAVVDACASLLIDQVKSSCILL